MKTVGMVLVMCAALAACLIVAGPAAAAPINPNIFTDTNVNDADCSLREAVTAANTDGEYNGCGAPAMDDPGDTISLSTAQPYTLSNGDGDESNIGGDLDIANEPLIIESAGPGLATIDASPLPAGNRALEISPLGFAGITTVTLSKLDITGGDSVDGGNIRHGVAVGSTLNIADSIVRDALAGGGIQTEGGAYLDILRSTIDGNTGSGGAGGITHYGSGVATITDSTISDNFADGGFGGGLWALPASGGATLRNTTISGNRADGSGGGLADSDVTILFNVTITDNTADFDMTDAAVDSDGGGGMVTGSLINFRNSIIAGNIDASPMASAKSPDCNGGGVISTQGFNLIGSTTGCPVVPVGGDLTNTSPVVGLLANNGGSTRTHALLSGSPAIDAGNDDSCELNDQRGIPRPQGPRCDIGAFEAPVPPAPVAAIPAAIAPITAAPAISAKRCKKGRKLKKGKCVKKKKKKK